MLRSLFQDGVSSSCFEVALRHTLGQIANDTKDLLVMIAQSRLGIGVGTRQAGYITVMALVGRIQRRRRLNIRVGNSRPAGKHRAGILLQHERRKVPGSLCEVGSLASTFSRCSGTIGGHSARCSRKGVVAPELACVASWEASFRVVSDMIALTFLLRRWEGFQCGLRKGLGTAAISS